MKKPEVSGGNNKSVFGSGFILLAKRVFVVDKQNFFIYISSIHVNTDAMNGISLTKIFQRAVGWCKTVYGVKCLAREHQTLSGYVIFQASVDPASGERTWDGMSRNSIPIRVVPRKLMPSSLSLRRRLFYDLPVSAIQRTRTATNHIKERTDIIMKNYDKYKVGYFPPAEPHNEWVKKDHIEKAPIWCSVDLRDGNQALIVPMSLNEKVEFFKYLVKIGFKQIEVGFPAASKTEYQFLRKLVDDDLIPDDVTVQVLTQSRKHIIKKTFEALQGVKKAVVHLYNSTSLAQREQVFKKEKPEIIKIATDGAALMKEYAAKHPETKFSFEYSPESFTGTEVDFAAEICNAVIDIWEPTPDNKVIINLPGTVEMSMPHVYASQIEYMCANLHNRENLIISLHPHNDRGTAVADAELGLLAGGDRIEGTLFGNGERTGNVDIVTVAMNMFCHGVDPELDFSNMPEVVETYEKYTDMKVNPRQPYGGQLVFAAFSGSHQDAIAKGMRWHKEKDLKTWSVPYLPLDPQDVGREYEADVIRINSQSGKGGIAYILEHNFGYMIPLQMREEIGYMVKDISDQEHKELTPVEVYQAFAQEYVNVFDPIDITDATFRKASDFKSNDGMIADIKVRIADEVYKFEAVGNGRLDAISNALKMSPYTFDYKFVTYSEHALSAESSSKAAAYVCIEDHDGNTFWGVGTHEDIILASVNALVSALNRQNRKDHFVE